MNQIPILKKKSLQGKNKKWKRKKNSSSLASRDNFLPAASIVKEALCPLLAATGRIVSAPWRLRAPSCHLARERRRKKNPGFILAYEDNYSYFFLWRVCCTAPTHTGWGRENVKTTPLIDGQRVHAIHGSVAFVESNWWKRSACVMGIISRRTDWLVVELGLVMNIGVKYWWWVV